MLSKVPTALSAIKGIIIGAQRLYSSSFPISNFAHVKFGTMGGARTLQLYALFPNGSIYALQVLCIDLVSRFSWNLWDITTLKSRLISALITSLVPRPSSPFPWYNVGRELRHQLAKLVYSGNSGWWTWFRKVVLSSEAKLCFGES